MPEYLVLKTYVFELDGYHGLLPPPPIKLLTVNFKHVTLYYCEDMLNLRHGVPCSEGFRSKVTLYAEDYDCQHK